MFKKFELDSFKILTIIMTTQRSKLVSKVTLTIWFCINIIMYQSSLVSEVTNKDYYSLSMISCSILKKANLLITSDI